MVCPKCGSTAVTVQMVTDTALQRARHGLIWWLLVGWWWVPLKWICFTWLALLAKIFAPKNYKLETEHRAVCVCQHCGFSGDAAEFAAPAPNPQPVATARDSRQVAPPAPEAVNYRHISPAGEADAECAVVGESFHRDAIAGLGKLSRAYYVPRDRLFGLYVEGDTVPKYEFERMEAELVPEPDNPHDANAIRVDVCGETIGYVPRYETERVRALLDEGATADVEITAGPDKLIRDAGGVLDFEPRDRDFSARLYFTVPEPKPEPVPRPLSMPVSAPVPEEYEDDSDDVVAALMWMSVAVLGACLLLLGFWAFSPKAPDLLQVFPQIFGVMIFSGSAALILACSD